MGLGGGGGILWDKVTAKDWLIRSFSSSDLFWSGSKILSTPNDSFWMGLTMDEEDIFSDILRDKSTLSHTRLLLWFVVDSSLLSWTIILFPNHWNSGKALELLRKWWLERFYNCLKKAHADSTEKSQTASRLADCRWKKASRNRKMRTNRIPLVGRWSLKPS